MIKGNVAQRRDSERNQSTQKSQIGITFFIRNSSLCYLPKHLNAGRRQCPQEKCDPQEANAGDKLGV